MQFRKANGSVYEKELFIKLGKLLLNLESDLLSFFFFFFCVSVETQYQINFLAWDEFTKFEKCCSDIFIVLFCLFAYSLSCLSLKCPVLEGGWHLKY